MEGLYDLFWIDCGNDTRRSSLVLLPYSTDIRDCERGDGWLYRRAWIIDLEEMTILYKGLRDRFTEILCNTL